MWLEFWFSYMSNLFSVGIIIYSKSTIDPKKIVIELEGILNNDDINWIMNEWRKIQEIGNEGKEIWGRDAMNAYVDLK